jgi:hypothetical protein
MFLGFHYERNVGLITICRLYFVFWYYSKFRSNPSQNNLPKRLKADATMMKPIKCILISTGVLKNSAIVPVVLIWLCLLSFYGIRFIWKGPYSHLEIQEKLWMISY